MFFDERLLSLEASIRKCMSEQAPKSCMVSIDSSVDSRNTTDVWAIVNRVFVKISLATNSMTVDVFPCCWVNEAYFIRGQADYWTVFVM